MTPMGLAIYSTLEDGIPKTPEERNMSELANQHCEACRADAPKVSEDELAVLIKEIPDWQPIVVDGILQLQRVYAFDNFVAALAFTNEVGAVAEAEGHHPAMLTEWGWVTVSWWSHKLRGLHKNDFICAALTDNVYRRCTNTGD